MEIDGKIFDILFGDCIDHMKEFEDSSIDIIITSPPYADRRKNTYGGIDPNNYCNWFIPIATEMFRILKDDGSLFINLKAHCDNGERVFYVWELVMKIRNEVGFRFVDEYCWERNGVPGKFKGRFKNAFEPVYHFAKQKDFTFNPYSVAHEMSEDSLKRAKRKACGESKNGSGFAGMRKNSTMLDKKLALPSNVLKFTQKSNQYTKKSNHPAVFPCELPEFFIKAFSNEGDIVYDPFCGSASTGIAALKNGRRFIGSEIKEEYVKLSNEIINDFLKNLK